MGLIQCPECGKEVSDKAKRCVNCGYPLRKRSKKIIGIIIAAVVAAIVIAVIICMVVMKHKSIVGTWSLDSFEIDGEKMITEQVKEKYDGKVKGLSECSIIFKENGEFTVTVDQGEDERNTLEGTYKVSGSKVLMTVDTTTQEFDYTGDTVSWEVNGIKVILKKE